MSSPWDAAWELSVLLRATRLQGRLHARHALAEPVVTKARQQGGYEGESGDDDYDDGDDDDDYDADADDDDDDDDDDDGDDDAGGGGGGGGGGGSGGGDDDLIKNKIKWTALWTFHAPTDRLPAAKVSKCPRSRRWIMWEVLKPSLTSCSRRRTRATSSF